LFNNPLKPSVKKTVKNFSDSKLSTFSNSLDFLKKAVIIKTDEEFRHRFDAKVIGMV